MSHLIFKRLSGKEFELVARTAITSAKSAARQLVDEFEIGEDEFWIIPTGHIRIKTKEKGLVSLTGKKSYIKS